MPLLVLQTRCSEWKRKAMKESHLLPATKIKICFYHHQRTHFHKRPSISIPTGWSWLCGSQGLGRLNTTRSLCLWGHALGKPCSGKGDSLWLLVVVLWYFLSFLLPAGGWERDSEGLFASQPLRSWRGARGWWEFFPPEWTRRMKEELRAMSKQAPS